ncbi:MAG TPA: carboxypeptidase regulatory-like domain-containing protein [Bryobacteraceae bacterium]|nr:carboxypeptidase regulatory-like domain-containing protein [Bryobacteraceae bacterium]
MAAVLSVMAILAIANLFTGQANAQVSGATLSGTITDPSGAAIAGAKVAIVNKATGVTRNVTTDGAGLYSAPNLLPGGYDVTVAASGFSTAKESDVTLTVGAQQTLNLSLRVGEASQTVEVTGAATAVQISNSTISSEIQSNTVRELPLNGRDWASLATLSPGVNALETQQPFENGALRGNRGFGAQLTISGGRPTQNNYRLDGLSINDYGNGGPGSVIGGNLGVDAIEEFSVITGNYSAEYGRTSGGIVNAISKSGTNAFHGDVYEFLRNTALDANDFFSNRNGLPTETYRRNQYGAAVGGPIRKDKTFLFFDYEGIRQAQGIPSGNANVPSDAARLGILAGQAPANQPAGTPCTNSWSKVPDGHYLSPLASVCVDDNAAKFLAAYPRPNGPVTGNVGNFVFAPLAVVHEDYYTTRLDHRISDKDSLFATYTFDDSPFTNQDGFDTVDVLNQVTRHIAALEETHIFSPTLLNTVRLGYNRDSVINYQTVGAIDPALGDASLSMLPGYDIPAMITSGLSRTSAGLPGGFTHFNWNSIQFYDDAFLTRGKHSLKFGFALERMRYNPFSLYQPNGLLRFTGFATGNGLEDLLTNQPHSLEGGLPVGVSPRGYRQTLFAGYIQDDWKVRPRLTLNVGLRYEMTTVLNEVEGKLTSLRNISDPLPYCGTSAPNAATTVLGVSGCAGVAPFYSNPTTLDFEPRFGFAYDPKGDGKTAIRGGFAIFDVLPLPGYFFSQAWAPFFLTGTVVNSKNTPIAGTLGIPPTSPGSAYADFRPKSSAGCTSPLGTCALTGSYVEPNPQRNYVEQWNINVQREITPSLTATVGYIGSHGIHMLIRGDDFDMVIPQQVSPGQFLWPAASNPNYPGGQQDLRINKNFGLIRGISWNTGSTYEALQFSVQKRMSHGFQFGGSYTYSKSMDNDSATILGDAFSNSITTWYWFAPQISRAVSDYNFTNTAVVNGIWQVPGPRTGLGHAVLGGWELGGILKLNSGIPTTPLISGDPMGVENNGSDTFGIPDKVAGCDPVNHNWKNTPGLTYINSSCYHVPMASEVPAAFRSQCVPFSAVPGSCSNLLGNAGRNSVIGPSLANLDVSAFKNISVKKISEAFNIQFRAEIFNVLNHANFGPPLPFSGASNAQIFNPDGSAAGGAAGGVQQPLVTLPRVIQFAVKVIF